MWAAGHKNAQGKFLKNARINAQWIFYDLAYIV